MAEHDRDIAEAWAAFQPVKAVKKYFQKVGRHQNGGSIYARPGTIRFSYDDYGDMHSYDMDIGLRSEDKHGRYLLLNADGAKSKRTADHQRTLLRAVERSGCRYGLVPFSALEGARIDPQAVRIIDRTPDRNEVRIRQTAKGPKEYSVHFLGELLFRVRGNYWLSGLDRNDNPWKRMYYLCALPGPANTVEEALESLRPKDVPPGTPRQGEWFFLPEDLPRYRQTEKLTKIPIISENPNTQGRRREGDRENRHVAQDMVLRPTGVYVRRTISDDEHTRLNLGMQWHRVRKNLARIGFRYTAGPGIQVD